MTDPTDTTRPLIHITTPDHPHDVARTCGASLEEWGRPIKHQADLDVITCPECRRLWLAERTPEEDLAIQDAMAVLAEVSPAIAAEQLIAATNYFGALAQGVRQRVLALVRHPSPDTWDDAHSIILSAAPGTGLGRTLWQAMMQVDPDCPRRGAPYALGETQTPAQRWDGYTPDPMTVLTAIRVAVGLQRTRPREAPPR